MSGSIRRRGERSWELKVELGRDPSTGKRQRRFHSFKGTKREAQVELTRLLASTADGSYIDPAKTSVAEFLDQWLRDWAGANVSPKTRERYQQIVRLNVVPHIGAMPLQRLKPAHLTQLYGVLLRQGGEGGRPLSARSVGHVHRLLHRALGHARQWGITAQNAADNVSPPRVEATEIGILREGDIKKLLGELRDRPLYMIAVLGLTTGLRRGEMLALRWQDIDGDRMRIERSLEQTKAGGLRFKSPKTKTSRRTISIPPAVVAELRGHRKAQQERWLALGLGKVRDDALVFATWEGKPRTPNALSKDWGEMMVRLGMKITLHALRHTHASQLIAAGMDVVTISRRLGHASPTITLGVYGHLFSNTDDRAAAIMEAAFSRMRTD
jgi:integrase